MKTKKIHHQIPDTFRDSAVKRAMVRELADLLAQDPEGSDEAASLANKLRKAKATPARRKAVQG